MTKYLLNPIPLKVKIDKNIDFNYEILLLQFCLVSNQ